MPKGKVKPQAVSKVPTNVAGYKDAKMRKRVKKLNKALSKVRIPKATK